MQNQRDMAVIKDCTGQEEKRLATSTEKWPPEIGTVSKSSRLTKVKPQSNMKTAELKI